MQVFSIFVFSFVSGTALSQLSTILSNPSSIVPLLGVAVPQQASFFITYILLLGLSKQIQQLLGVPKLVIFWIKARFAATDRAQKKLWQPKEEMFGKHIPTNSIVLLLGLVFCVQSPLICPFVLLYFVVGNITQRYTWLYIYKAPYLSKGLLWMQVFHQVREHSTATHNHMNHQLYYCMCWYRTSMQTTQCTLL